MDFSVIIPARFNATRLPKKLLLDLAGKTVLQHVFDRACQSAAREVIIATDHSAIESVAKDFGAKVVLTSPDLPSGTDRIQSAAQKLGMGENEVVINVQGDEAFIDPKVIDQLANHLITNDLHVATVASPVKTISDLFNPHVVKVVTDKNQNALYFSRAPIAWNRDAYEKQDYQALQNSNQVLNDGAYLRHIGIYGYRVELLNQFVSWPLAPLEKLECLEQLRILWNGYQIGITKINDTMPSGIDTIADLKSAEDFIASLAV